jgi:uncharacterized protein (TIGR00266 family)
MSNEGQVLISGAKSFSYLLVDIPPGSTLVTEPGAMASMDDGLELSVSLNGGFIGAILLRIFGSESIFINRFVNSSQQLKRLYLTQTTPGEIVCERISGESFYIQPGSFIASTQGVSFRLKWAGISSWLAREGLFRLQVNGQGLLWFGSYGAVVEKEINGRYIVDSGHLLSYPPTVQLKAKLAGGIFSSLFGGEGLVLELSGHGKVRLQTRSLPGLASWLNPWFY